MALLTTCFVKFFSCEILEIQAAKPVLTKENSDVGTRDSVASLLPPFVEPLPQRDIYWKSTGKLPQCHPLP